MKYCLGIIFISGISMVNCSPFPKKFKEDSSRKISIVDSTQGSSAKQKEEISFKFTCRVYFEIYPNIEASVKHCVFLHI